MAQGKAHLKPGFWEDNFDANGHRKLVAGSAQAASPPAEFNQDLQNAVDQATVQRVANLPASR
jgi:hypothetical protein